MADRSGRSDKRGHGIDEEPSDCADLKAVRARGAVIREERIVGASAI